MFFHRVVEYNANLSVISSLFHAIFFEYFKFGTAAEYDLFRKSKQPTCNCLGEQIMQIVLQLPPRLRSITPETYSTIFHTPLSIFARKRQRGRLYHLYCYHLSIILWETLLSRISIRKAHKRCLHCESEQTFSTTFFFKFNFT